MDNSKMDSFDSAMHKAGITSTDINSRAYEHIKNALANNPDIFIGDYLGDAIKEAAKIATTLTQQTGAGKVLVIQDYKLRDAVAVFNAVINAVKATFGESAMSPEVICTAIVEGGFAAWRAIMGEAHPKR